MASKNVTAIRPRPANDNRSAEPTVGEIGDEVYSAATDLLASISLLEAIGRGMDDDAELDMSLRIVIRRLHDAHNRFDVASGRLSHIGRAANG